MPRPLKHTRLIITAAVLGLLTTVAVCWGLAAWMPQKDWRVATATTAAEPPKGESPFTAYEFRAFGSIRRFWSTADPSIGFWPELVIQDTVTSHGDKPFQGFPQHQFPQWDLVDEFLLNPSLAPTTACEHAAGWPIVCASYDINPNPAGPRTFRVEHGILIQIPPPTTRAVQLYNIRALPCLPIWPGLLIDTGFYAACWALIILAFSAITRRLRRRRGVCTACSYDRAGLAAGAACPECGAAPATP